ncbi:MULTISPECIES: DUF1997 domain-containing protein [unclassified Tolypothrix]|uniref:DUF1997 domain-containing protein n=1 Tax=unclassified Tolypothrix TaxID=2649714 RepID=UPI0005EAAB9C|nr:MULTISPECIES: DUF1997 domain-containing protein [unclassified Tolypothrix]BAY92845.1 hypothetical protein NIES3275_48820 [Microchaete diplosiphon NIES-3275]EKF02928.1 hypothetical protein FDUTEX481_05731 [Tolypothrix sp. PCC 7601]MBE9087964.1 DUF1997 domain-containing protein [Tolypothrix sp. LEGE 11397]UYD26761.1 DUF1997 domain-containing protein [Tolypothrix sp. PCC 7712]UYD37382.1 DUF1997 domain-containing protein [Tolypothrix sp. PCC 7601]
MLSRNGEYKSLEITETVLPVASSATEAEDALTGVPVAMPTKFYGSYSDCMEMYAPSAMVAEYLNTHSSWFSRCAEPMKVQPLGENGYALIIGRFGSFGYEVEPKIGLELLPADEGVYRIRTIPIPDYQSPGYDVDYRASLQLVENVSEATENFAKVTKVEWELDLVVELHFPKFIQRLPKSLIQSTGDRVLNQIVRQVSRRLTRKVQEDFHQSLGIPFNAAKKKR